MDITKQSSKLESPEAKPTNVQEERFFFRNRIILQSSIERITIPIGRYRPLPPKGSSAVEVIEQGYPNEDSSRSNTHPLLW